MQTQSIRNKISKLISVDALLMVFTTQARNDYACGVRQGPTLKQATTYAKRCHSSLSKQLKHAKTQGELAVILACLNKRLSDVGSDYQNAMPVAEVSTSNRAFDAYMRRARLST